MPSSAVMLGERHEEVLKHWQEGQSEEDARKCPSCGGRLGLKLAKSGGFIGCSNYPDCSYARPLDPAAHGDSAPGASQAHACVRKPGSSAQQDV